MAWRLMQYNQAFNRLWAECTEEMRDSIRPRLSVVLARGNQAGPPITEPLGDGLFEVKARSGRVRIRLLFGYLPRQHIVFVWGGTKDQRRLPPATIRRARELLIEAQASFEVLDVVRFN